MNFKSIVTPTSRYAGKECRSIGLPYGSRLDSQRVGLRSSRNSDTSVRNDDLIGLPKISFRYLDTFLRSSYIADSLEPASLTKWTDHVTKNSCLFFHRSELWASRSGYRWSHNLIPHVSAGLSQSTKILRRGYKPHYGDCMIGLFRILTLCRECCRYLVWNAHIDQSAYRHRRLELP
jgi:hypothetical protein